MINSRILFSIPSQSHVGLALDEMEGLRDLNYTCDGFTYAAKDGYESFFKRIYIVIVNAFALIKKAKEFKPDVIYFNSRLEMRAGIRDFITLLILKIFYSQKVILVLKSHGSEIDVFESDKYVIRRIVMPFLRNNINAWLFLSSEERNELIAKSFLPADKIFITKNIVRIDQFIPDSTFKNRLNIPADNKILLFVGRIIRDKGIFDVVEAFNKIQSLYKTTLIIVGSGEDSAELENYIATNNLTDKVILTGWITEGEVVEYYANSNMLLFPTYCSEGFPMALFNSIAAGLPVVTTAIRAATDFLTEPENCLWVKPKSGNDVAKAVTRLLENDALVASMSANNKVKAKLFCKAQVCKEIAETLQCLK
jgi:glycosyltransferase involved in cell wall biosynthesis